GSITVEKSIITVCMVIMMFVLVACEGNKVDESCADHYIKEADKIIDLVNDGNYEETHSNCDENMKSQLPVEDMEELTEIIEQAGKFSEISKASVEEKDDLYVTVLVAKYSAKKLVFTITLDENDKVAGLYIK